MSTQKTFLRSPCALANSLDLVGDRWSLLVVRDLLQGKHTYGELADSREGIPTNILAASLVGSTHESQVWGEYSVEADGGYH